MITLNDAVSWAITAVEGDPLMGKWTDGEGNPITTRTKVIYGNGGQNRYFVMGNEVTFSAFHSTPEGIEKAKSVGFRIHK